MPATASTFQHLATSLRQAIGHLQDASYHMQRASRPRAESVEQVIKLLHNHLAFAQDELNKLTRDSQ